MRITPTVENRNPWPCAVTAQYMTAPAAMARMLNTIPVRPISHTSVSLFQPSIARSITQLLVGTTPSDRTGHRPRECSSQLVGFVIGLGGATGTQGLRVAAGRHAWLVPNQV